VLPALLLAVSGLLVAGCETELGPLDAEGCPRAPRYATELLEIDDSGLSAQMVFALPGHTRGLSIELEGEEGALHALGALVPPDGIDRVGLPAGTEIWSLLEQTADRLVAPLPYGIYQLPQRGLFTYLWPSRVEAPLVCGHYSLRVATQARQAVRATVRLPPTDGADQLHLTAHWVSDDAPASGAIETLLGGAAETLDQAGIRLILDGQAALTGTDFDVIDEPLGGAPRGRGSELAALAQAGMGRLPPSGVQVFIVEQLGAGGVDGYSLGVPGPVDPRSPLNGVFVRVDPDLAAHGRSILAHELAHFLGLHHVEQRGADGIAYPDPLADTQPGEDNLMDPGGGRVLSPQQSEALRASPLLRTD